MANNTERGVADQRVAVATDPRAGVAADAADCSTVGSPPVEPRYSCPAAGSARAAVADAVAAGSVDPAVFGGAVADDGRVVAAAVAVVDDGRVVAAAVAVAVAVLDVVVPRKLLPNLPDSAAAAGVDGVREAPAVSPEVVRTWQPVLTVEAGPLGSGLRAPDPIS